MSTNVIIYYSSLSSLLHTIVPLFVEMYVLS